MKTGIIAVMLATAISFTIGVRLKSPPIIIIQDTPKSPVGNYTMSLDNASNNGEIAFINLAGLDTIPSKQFCSDDKAHLNKWHYKFSGETGRLIFSMCFDGNIINQEIKASENLYPYKPIISK